MWRNREVYGNKAIELVAGIFEEVSPSELRYWRDYLVGQADLDGYGPFVQELVDVLSIPLDNPPFVAHSPVGSMLGLTAQLPLNPAFVKAWTSLLRRRALDISHRAAYDELVALWRIVASLASPIYQNGRKPRLAIMAVTVYVQCLHLGVGTERKVLVSSKDGKPGYLELETPLDVTSNGSEELMLGRFGPALGSLLQYTLPEDVDLLAQPSEFVDPPDVAVPEGAVAGLLEAAVYGRRYAVHPLGVRVVFQDDPYLTAVTLKVRRSADGLNCDDLIGWFETPTGKFFSVLPGHDPVDQYHFYVLAKIYHDLVVVEDAPIVEHESEAIAVPVRRQRTLELVEGAEVAPRYTYLRRHRRGSPAPARVRYDGPRRVRPHAVGAFPRKGSMSDRHREAVQRFEEEFDVRLLDLAREGETVVLPYTKPPLSSDAFAQLPELTKQRLRREFRMSVEGLPSEE